MDPAGNRNAVASQGEADSNAIDTANSRNELEIQFVGLQRSGNHAVLAWIFQQFEKPVYFFNNVEPFTDPILNFRYAEMPNAVVVRRGPAPKQLTNLEKIRPTKKHVLIYSYENLVLKQLRDKPLVPDHDILLGTSSRVRRVLLLRDFYNWMASRLRLYEERGASIPPLSGIRGHALRWISYAEEYIGETAFMRDEALVTISYNRWVSDGVYRAEVLDRLGIPLRDNANVHIPNVGGGSSFDAQAFSGRPDQMLVGDRWRYLLEDKFKDVLEIVNKHRVKLEYYNTKIFGLLFPF